MQLSIFKTAFFTLSLMGATLAAHAQTEGAKAKRGFSAFEVSMNPWPTASATSGINTPYLRLRGYMSPQASVRIAFTLASLSETGGDSIGNSMVNYDRSMHRFELRVGLERNVVRTDHALAYIGFETIFGLQGSSSLLKRNTNGREENGRVANATQFDANGQPLNNAYQRLGLGGFMGCDFFPMPRVYVGLEAGVSYHSDAMAATSEDFNQRAHITKPAGTRKSLGWSPAAGLKAGFRF